MLKEFFLRTLANLFKGLAPQLVSYLLAMVDPVKLADALRPHLKALMSKMGPDWQEQFVTAFRKLTKFLEKLLADDSVGT